SHSRMAQQDVEHVADPHAAAAARVVDLARRAAFGGEPVCAHHVACIGPVAFGIEIAAVQYRVLETSLDLGDLLGKAAGGEDLPATRPGVVEPARHDALEPVAAEELDRQRFWRHFADRVRAEWAQRIAL